MLKYASFQSFPCALHLILPQQSDDFDFVIKLMPVPFRTQAFLIMENFHAFICQ